MSHKDADAFLYKEAFASGNLFNVEQVNSCILIVCNFSETI